jgi:hypothetical protein
VDPAEQLISSCAKRVIVVVSHGHKSGEHRSVELIAAAQRDFAGLLRRMAGKLLSDLRTVVS